MSSAPTDRDQVITPRSADARGTDGPPRKKSKRRRTAHLKVVPESRQLRELIRDRAVSTAARIDKSRPLSKEETEAVSRAVLSELNLPEGYLGWTMVVFASEFWRAQVAAVPYDRRLFLLPHCLKHAEGCPADYDEFGLDCRKCGACSIADFRARAEALGYKVLVAEGSPIVMKIIVGGYVDAVVGVACLNVLEKAIDRILLAGVPSMAVPLLSSDCRNTSVDEDWVAELINTPHVEPKVHTRSYVHLMRAAAEMFQGPPLDRLAMRHRPSADLAGRGKLAADPIAVTETLALDFLAQGGKHSRPFITLAAYDAVTGGHATTGEGARVVAKLPDAVKRAAMAIETFHKASLVHDDIEDDDLYRYGEETLHHRFGTPTAINVGDYLIGLGYRLVSRETEALGAEVAGDILDRLAAAHMRLSEGQGAELYWRDTAAKPLKPIDALKIYALKTAPAFEAALYAGLRLAGSAEPYRDAVAAFARHLGVAFQILNDLGDWQGDQTNKRIAAGDVLGGRPTVLWALALEGLKGEDREQLQQLVAERPLTSSQVARVRALYRQAGVFEQAHRLVDKYQQRAEAVADEVQPKELRCLLYYLIDTVLERPAEEPPPVIVSTIDSPLPVATAP